MHIKTMWRAKEEKISNPLNGSETYENNYLGNVCTQRNTG